MVGWKSPWRYAQKNILDERKAKRLAGSLQDTLSDGVSGAKNTAKDIADRADEEFGDFLKTGKRAGGLALKGLDAAAEYGGRPAAAVITGQLTEERKMGADGQYYRDAPELIEGPRSWKKALTQNPIDTYQQAREASHERYRDPALQKDIVGRVALSAASDPLNFIPAGAGARLASTSLAASKGGRGAIKAVEAFENTKAGLLGANAGAAGAGWAAEKLDLPDWAQTTAQLAGGVVGGGANVLTTRANRKARQGMPKASVVDIEHPDVDVYTSTLDKYEVDYAIDADGRIVPDEEALYKALREAEDLVKYQRGGFTAKTRSRNQRPFTEVFGESKRQAARYVYKGRGEVDADVQADLDRLLDIQSEMVPTTAREADRVAAIEEFDANNEARQLEREDKTRPIRPRLEPDTGGYSYILKADGTKERVYTATPGARARAMEKVRIERERPAGAAPDALVDTTGRAFDSSGRPLSPKVIHALGRPLRHSVGKNVHPIEFADQTEKALYILGRVPVAKRAERAHLLGLTDKFPDESVNSLAARGRAISRYMDEVASETEPGKPIFGTARPPKVEEPVIPPPTIDTRPDKALNERLGEPDSGQLSAEERMRQAMQAKIDEVRGFDLPEQAFIPGDAKPSQKRANNAYNTAARVEKELAALNDPRQVQSRLRQLEQAAESARAELEAARAATGPETVKAAREAAQKVTRLEDAIEELTNPTRLEERIATLQTRAAEARDLSQRADLIGPKFLRSEPARPSVDDAGNPNGADLLQLPSRQRAVSGEAAYESSRAGRVDQGVRKVADKTLGPILRAGGGDGAASNIVRDPRITPIQQGMNQAENTRASLKATVERKLHDLERSGIKFVDRGDGNWVEERSGLAWSDIVERNTAEGRAAWDALTPEQQRITQDLIDLQERANQTLVKYGGKLDLLQHEGDHWPRRVTAIDGEERAKGNWSNRMVGSTQDAQKQRTMATAQDAMDNRNITYSHPFDAYAAAFDQKLKVGQDSWVRGMVEPLGEKVPDAGHPMADLTVPAHPALRNMRFDPEVGTKLQGALATPSHSGVGSFLKGINSYLTPIRASLDFSATFQQGAKMWVTNPVAAAKHWKTTFHSLKNPDAYFNAQKGIDMKVREVLAEAGIDTPDGLEWLSSHKLRQTASGEMGNEFALRTATGPFKTAGDKSGYNWVAGKSQEHFDRLLNLYRAESAKNELVRLVKQGKRGDELGREMKKANSAINRAFGWSENKPSSAEQMGFFAPRFFRANIESLYKATTDWSGIEGTIARQHLGMLAASGAALTVAVNEARGYETEFRPWKSNFMRMKNMGGIDVSPYGPYDTLVRYAITAGKEAGQGKAPTSALKLLESKASPVAGQAIAQIKGETYMGEPMNSFEKRVYEAFKGTMPFGVTNIIEQGIEDGSPRDALTSGLVSATGLKNNPTTPDELIKLERTGHEGFTDIGPKVAGEAQRQYQGRSYEDLSGTERSTVNDAPQIRALQGKADERSMKRDDRRGQATEIRTAAKAEIEASGRYLAAKQDDSGNPFSGNDYRKAYNDTMMRAAGKYELLGADDRDDDVSRWFNLYDQAKLPNGTVDYDRLEVIQAEFSKAHPGIEEKVDEVTGIRDDANMRELRAARKEASEYYSIPAYRGMSLEDGNTASEVLKVAGDMVRFGRARDRAAALRAISRAGNSKEVALARRALRRKSNSAREKFRKSHDLFAKYYSEADLIDEAA